MFCIRDQYQCIGDIMRKLTPFLKLYTEYVKNFEVATTLVETWGERSSAFNKLLKEIRVSIKESMLLLLNRPFVEMNSCGPFRKVVDLQNFPICRTDMVQICGHEKGFSPLAGI